MAKFHSNGTAIWSANCGPLQTDSYFDMNSLVYDAIYDEVFVTAYVKEG